MRTVHLRGVNLRGVNCAFAWELCISQEWELCISPRKWPAGTVHLRTIGETLATKLERIVPAVGVSLPWGCVIARHYGLKRKKDQVSKPLIHSQNNNFSSTLTGLLPGGPRGVSVLVPNIFQWFLTFFIYVSPFIRQDYQIYPEYTQWCSFLYSMKSASPSISE